MTRVVVAHRDEVEQGRVFTDLPNGEPVLVVQHQGQWYAVGGLCPHQFAPLLGGQVDDNGVLTCPLHGWRFDLRDGRDPGNEFICVPTWPCGWDGDELWVDIAEP